MFWKKLQNNSKLLANIDVETNIDKTSIIKQILKHKIIYRDFPALIFPASFDFLMIHFLS